MVYAYKVKNSIALASRKEDAPTFYNMLLYSNFRAVSITFKSGADDSLKQDISDLIQRQGNHDVTGSFLELMTLQLVNGSWYLGLAPGKGETNKLTKQFYIDLETLIFPNGEFQMVKFMEAQGFFGKDEPDIAAEKASVGSATEANFQKFVNRNQSSCFGLC